MPNGLGTFTISSTSCSKGTGTTCQTRRYAGYLKPEETSSQISSKTSLTHLLQIVHITIIIIDVCSNNTKRFWHLAEPLHTLHLSLERPVILKSAQFQAKSLGCLYCFLATLNKKAYNIRPSVFQVENSACGTSSIFSTSRMSGISRYRTSRQLYLKIRQGRKP